MNIRSTLLYSATSLLMFFPGIFYILQAQEIDPKTWNSTPLHTTAKEKWILLSDYSQQEDYEAAKHPLCWLLKNVPDLDKLLYTKGRRVYHHLVREEKNQKLKAEYQDSALALYDRQIHYFGDEAIVLNQKGYYALAYWQKRPEKYEYLYDLYKKIVELNGNDTFSLNVKNYIYLIGVMRNKAGTIDYKRLLKVQGELSKIATFNMERYEKEGNAKAVKDWEGTQEFLDQNVPIYDPVPCDIIESKMFPKYKEDPSNIPVGKSIYEMYIKAGCTNEDSFLTLVFLLVHNMIKQPFRQFTN